LLLRRCHCARCYSFRKIFSIAFPFANSSTSFIMTGAAEILVYGTAVVVE
jgi:hypothetical protein